MYSSDSLDYLTLLFGGAITGVLFCGLILAVLHVVIMWKLFTKMGLEGWKAIIPFYNLYVLCEKLFGNGLYMLAFLVGCVPAIGGILLLFVQVILSIRMAKAFNQETPFAIGLVLLAIVFQGILAFGNAQYTQLPDYDIHHPFE